MAELIPVAYRLRVQQRKQLARWYLIAGAVALVSLASLGGMFLWEHQCWSEREALSERFQEKSTLISSAQQVRASRQELASRMATIQQLREDKVLLSLLQHISGGFSGKDLLQSISIDTRASSPNQPGTPAGQTHYTVRLSGFTESSSSLANLMMRIGKQSRPPVNVLLESSRRGKVANSEVMHFEIVCEQPSSKGL